MATLPHDISLVQRIKEILTPSQIKILPVANVLDYGFDLPLHLTTVGLTEQSITFSSASITRSLRSSAQPLDNLPHVYSDTDAGLLLHEGDDTTFEKTYVFESDMEAVVYKTSINVAMALNVSVYSAGTYNLGNLTVDITDVGSTTTTIFKNTFASTAANRTSTGTDLHWFTVDLVKPYQVFPNQPIKIKLSLDVTTGTGTHQEGIVSVAPFVNTASMKSFAESAIIFHVHADLAHADDIFRFNMKRVAQLG